MNYYHQLRVEKERLKKENVLKKVVKCEYDTYNDLDGLLYKAREYFDSDLIKKHFNDNTLEKLLENLFDTRGSYKNGVKVSLIKSGLRDLKNETRQMPNNEINNKRVDVIVNLVEKILDANERQLDRFYTPRSDTSDFKIREMFENEEETSRDMPELENEESAAQRKNQRGKGLKILIPKQMLSRLPISLTQLKAGNNSEKLKSDKTTIVFPA